jgi:3-methyladenine DNA glycosylase Tag
MAYLKPGMDSAQVIARICYALMQATGLVNDHLVGCFRYSGVNTSGGD